MTRALVAAVLAVPLTVLAHHGWSEYDASKALKLTGKIVESGYEHPHGHVRLETPGKTWNVVLAPPSRMERPRRSRAMRTATSPKRCAPSASPSAARPPS